MKILLHAFYSSVKVLTKVALRVFYRRVTIVNRERLRLVDAPYILVSNHPNTMIDPLWTASLVNRTVHFLANAGLFKTPFTNWFFSTFFCIRVERPTDVDGRPLKNDVSFALSSRHLAQNGVLYIAPEAYSHKGRKLLPLKTGTMRIALSAEKAQDFQLGVRILPVGLNYDSAYDFRSNILIRVGEPITITEYAEEYEKAPYQTAHKLTRLLEKRLQSLVLTTQDMEEDERLAKMETMLQHDQPMKALDHHLRTQKLLAGFQQWKARSPEDGEHFQQQIDRYFKKLDEARLSDRDIARPGSCRLLQRSVLAILSLPLFAYGWLNNYPAAFAPEWIRRKIKQYEEYDATVKILAGLFTVPLLYLLQYAIVKQFLPAPFPLLYLLSLPPLGWLAWELKMQYDRLLSSWRFQRSRRQTPDLIRKLVDERKAIRERMREWESR